MTNIRRVDERLDRQKPDFRVVASFTIPIGECPLSGMEKGDALSR